MPYASGETPEIGDYVKNGWEQPGTVVDVISLPGATGNDDFVSIRWDDGGRDAASLPAQGYTLISKQK